MQVREKKLANMQDLRVVADSETFPCFKIN
jgi:hypothetical protein